METTSDTLTQHPVLACAAQIDSALKSVAHLDPTFMPTTEKADALLELTRLENQLASLRLKVIAAAGDVAETDASRSVAAWIAPRTLTEHAPNGADERLAVDLAQRWTVVGAGLGDARVNLAQARVIVKALGALGDDVEPDLLKKAEAHLVAQAAHFTPKDLKRLGDKILEVIAPDTYDDQERKKLEEQQRRANAATRLSFTKRGDGSTDIHARVPDLDAARLKAFLEAFTQPRKAGDGHGDGDGEPGSGAGGSGAGPITDPATGQRIPADRRMGHAFCALLTALDPTQLPIHGGNTTTLVVTMDFDNLKAGIGAATLPDGTRISAGEARRLACTAGIIPVVLGTDSEVLDAGLFSRLFKPAQKRAMGIEHPTCRAVGCTIPAAWCEAHHWKEPWSQGGKTDLADGKLLCNWHHHRAHDPTYDTEHLPNGGVRFHKRT